MDKDFSEIMAQRTDKQLAEILMLRHNEYQPEALIAAEAEVKKRQINISALIAGPELAEAEKRKIDPQEKKDQGLNVGFKILTFLLPVILLIAGKFIFITILEMPPFAIVSFPATIILQVFIFRQLKGKGHIKMAADFKSWTLNCWIFFTALFVLQMILQMIAKGNL
jgi:hypothetical protein